jgi:hypothetical protein
MDKLTFNREMARLSIAFDRVLTPPLLSTYWDRVKNHRDDLFTETTDRLIDSGDAFPNVATLHRMYYRIRDERHAPIADEERPRDAALELGRQNAARLAREGLPSDVMLARGHGVRHRVGSPMHAAILKTYDKMARTLMYQIDERSAQADASPNNPDLRRRVEVLVQTLSDTEKRRAHFEATGETLPLVNLAPDAVGVTPGTLYLCPMCRATGESPGRFVRLDVTPGSAHFGNSIPCPECRPAHYRGYVEAKGQPVDLPWPDPSVQAVPWKEHKAS